MDSWSQGAEVFRQMPRRSLLIFAAAVTLLFADLGAVNDSFTLEHSNTFQFVWTVLFTSVTAALWAVFGAMRMRRSMIVLAICQVLLVILGNRWIRPPDRVLTPGGWQSEVVKHAIVEAVLIVLGYIAFIMFFRREGRRFFAAHTEIKLASAIQQSLVPPVEAKAGNWEFYGHSIPSGAVGGDLLDVVQADGGTCAYVADVAGHGVPAGVLMSMVKAAMRMRLAQRGESDGMLESLNDVLTPMTDSRSYATFAYVFVTAGDQLTFSLAGHLPLFHYCSATGRVERRSVENLPLAMFPGTAFATAHLKWEQGDVFAIVTDGLTELANGKGQEIGMDYIERALADGAKRPLQEIARQILGEAERYGHADDDRTLLLMRAG